MANVNVGTPRAMLGEVSGVRPSTDPSEKSSLKKGGLFVNLPDNVLCVGTGSGGYIVFALNRVGTVAGNG